MRRNPSSKILAPAALACLVAFVAAISAGCSNPAGAAQPGADDGTKVTVKQVSAGERHTMILESDGTLWATGYNASGQLGDGTTDDRYSPAIILEGVASVSTGSAHTMFIKADGSLWAMGSNNVYAMGAGSQWTANSTPLWVMDGVASVFAGGQYTAVLRADGSLWTMGSNGSGQLGNGGTVTQAGSERILEGGVATVAAGFNHLVVLKTDGTVWATGNNEYGQLGNGTKANSSSLIQLIIGGVAVGDAVAIAAGNNHTVILRSDGSLWGMGSNSYGQIGSADYMSSRTTPARFVDGGVAEVYAGSCFTLFRKTDGSVWGLGEGRSGELGNGHVDDVYTTPTRMLLEGGVKAVSAGNKHTMVIGSDGTLWATGWNYSGQLGNGDATGASISTLAEIVLE